MKRLIFFCLTLLFTLAHNARTITLKNDTLKVTFDESTANFEVTDLRNGKIWKQNSSSFQVKSAKLSSNSISAKLIGDINLKLLLSLRQDAITVELTSADGMQMEYINYPSSFYTESKENYLLLTDSEGILLPVDDKEYPFGSGISYFCGGGLSMPWMGITDKNFETGYMAILDTPFDAGLRPFRQENGLISFQPYWLSSYGKLNYTRRLIYRFFNEGGYVAQCKSYRNYIWKKNGVLTLKEKEKKNPAIGKIVGAPHIYVWDTGRDIEFAKDLKRNGIDKAFLLWNSNHTPYPVKGYRDSLNAIGYAVGGYELFSDLHLRDTVSHSLYNDGPLYLRHSNYPGQFKELAARKKDGGTYSNTFGTYACPFAMKQNIADKMKKTMADYPSDATFIDVYVANGLYECYNSKHPLSREGYAKSIIENYDYVGGTYGQILGGEWGADFANSYLSFMHGMMTIQYPLWQFNDTGKKGTIYYSGNWRNNSRPSIMIGSYTASDNYLKFCLNEAIRVPLYELVYHDVIMTTWRWEDCNHHSPEIWWKKDLFNMLYGSCPIWSLDFSRWENWKESFIESYKRFSPWLQKICYDEMINHSFITSDGKIQKTEFSSGYSIVVNFSDNDFIYQGKVLNPHSYVILFTSNYKL